MNHDPKQLAAATIGQLTLLACQQGRYAQGDITPEVSLLFPHAEDPLVIHNILTSLEILGIAIDYDGDVANGRPKDRLTLIPNQAELLIASGVDHPVLSVIEGRQPAALRHASRG
jgi:hypothetical protein